MARPVETYVGRRPIGLARQWTAVVGVLLLTGCGHHPGSVGSVPSPVNTLAPERPSPTLEVTALASKQASPIDGLALQFTERGLSPGVDIRFQMTAEITAGFTCVTLAGGSTWTEKRTRAQTFKTVTTDADGVVHGTIVMTIGGSGILACSVGAGRLAKYRFDHVIVTDLANGIEAPGPDVSGQFD